MEPRQVKVLLLAEEDVPWEDLRELLSQLAEVVKFEAVGSGYWVTLQW